LPNFPVAQFSVAHFTVAQFIAIREGSGSDPESVSGSGSPLKV